MTRDWATLVAPRGASVIIRPERSRMATKSRPSRERILDYLAQHGGRITSADGRGLTTALARAAGYRDLSPLNAMLARLEQKGDIRREVRGRRTYAISLTRRGRSSRTQRARDHDARRQRAGPLGIHAAPGPRSGDEQASRGTTQDGAAQESWQRAHGPETLERPRQGERHADGRQGRCQEGGHRQEGQEERIGQEEALAPERLRTAANGHFAKPLSSRSGLGKPSSGPERTVLKP